jgi:hypothetical protein
VNVPERFTGAEAALHAAASAATGLDDFGPGPYRAGLTALLEAFDNDGPRFAPGGRDFAWRTLVGALVSRLTLQHQLKAHPEVTAAPIRRPLIITGIPRTGTTALHKLLSMDDQFQGLEKWLTVFPQPRPPQDTWPAHPHYQATAAGLEAFFAAAPAMRAAHDMNAHEVDECLEILKLSFCSNLWGSSFRVPAYDRWWSSQDEAPPYQLLLQALQLIGANDPDKTWLLKNPGHVMQLDTLLDTFPDACVVQTHRDPARALPSLCSVLVMARSLTEGDEVNLHEIGDRESRQWAEAVEKTMAVREQRPGHFFDVRHSEFVGDPMAVVERLYGHFGLTLSDTARQRMLARIAEQPERRHGPHEYTAEQFGLDTAALRQRYARYIEACRPG